MRPRLWMTLAGAALLIGASLLIARQHQENDLFSHAPAIPRKQSPAARFADAARHLEQGKSCEYAMAQLRAAVGQEPGSATYHTALGCAYADRAASLGYAENFTVLLKQDNAKYPQTLADWQKAQSDPKNPLYGTARPTPLPQFLTTKDDHRPFTLTETEAGNRINALGRAAVQEWRNGVTLSKTPKDRANAEYVQGWGMLLLYPLRNLTPDITLSSIPTEADAARAFASAAKDAPLEARIWESLGFADAPDAVLTALDEGMMKSGGAEKAPRMFQQSAAAALRPYRTALALQPDNAPLWFMLSSRENYHEPVQARSDLMHAIASAPGKAYPLYQLAYLDLEETLYRKNSSNNPAPLADKQKIDDVLATEITPRDKRLGAQAIALMEQASRLPNPHASDYHPPVPRLLAFAWEHWGMHEEDVMKNMALRALARDASGYAKISAIQQHAREGKRAERAVIGMGRNLIGVWPIKDSAWGGDEVVGALTGVAIVHIGYQGLMEIAQRFGTPQQVQRVRSEQDGFQRTLKPYLKAAGANTNPYQMY